MRLSRGVTEVRLRSRRFVPAQMQPGSIDHRTLGIAVARLWLDGAEIPLTAGALGVGWHGAEPHWRWTGGDAALRVGGAGELAFEVAITGRYWQPRHWMSVSNSGK